MRLAVVAVLALLAGAAPAGATTFCVATSEPGCVERPTVAAALAAAADEPGTDTVRIGRHTEDGVFDDDGGAVRIVGAGRGATVLGRVDLGEDASGLSGADRAATGSRCAATGRTCEVTGDVRLRDGADLRSSAVAGTITTAGAVAMHSVLAAGVDVESGTLSGRHLTVGSVSGRAALVDSIVTTSVSGAVDAARSILPGTDPGLLPTFVPAPGSPAVDADAEPLEATEPQEDAAAPCGSWTGTATAPRAATSARSSARRRRRRRPPAT